MLYIRGFLLAGHFVEHTMGESTTNHIHLKTNGSMDAELGHWKHRLPGYNTRVRIHFLYSSLFTRLNEERVM